MADSDNPTNGGDLESLRRDIRHRLLAHIDRVQSAFGQLHTCDPKEAVRQMHSTQRDAVLARTGKALSKHVPRLLNTFAIASDVDPVSIAPELVPVDANDDSGLLFRLATTLWSVPVSSGYGRRMRFLVKDRSNGKLIGLFALGDPVAGMGARDKWIGWDAQQRRKRLSSVLDAYVCGAVPPYNMLLGGKLVVCLMSSSEVVREFDRRYRYRPNHWGQFKFPRLALITVTSALGRSSLYNRVKLPGIVDLHHLDNSTSGWGHFQVPDDVFRDMRRLLSMDDHKYADGHQFGDGPNWRLRTIREALGRVGLSTDTLRHGISRDVFAMPLAKNWREYLNGEIDECQIDRPNANVLSRAAIVRWVLPRSQRVDTWQRWSDEDRSGLFKQIESKPDDAV